MCTLRGGQQCVVRAKPHSLGLNGEKGKSESEMPRFKYLRNPLKKKNKQSLWTLDRSYILRQMDP